MGSTAFPVKKSKIIEDFGTEIDRNTGRHKKKHYFHFETLQASRLRAGIFNVPGLVNSFANFCLIYGYPKNQNQLNVQTANSGTNTLFKFTVS